MDLQAFTDSPIGTLVPISGTDPRTGQEFKHKAFLPSPLPRSAPELQPRTWTAVTKATLALGRLDEAGQRVPNPTLLSRPSIRREAVSTSALEGTYAPFEDVLEADVADEKSGSGAVQEVLNYVRVAEAALELVPENPISIGMLTQWQAMLVRGTPGDTEEAGRIRELQVIIGAEGSPVEDARFVPPPPGDQLVAGLRDWEQWLEEDNGIDDVVSVALAHYQFETLHPFNDGNGRLGRLMIVLQLMRRRVLHHGLLTISPWLEQRKREYQDHLLNLSQTGDLDPWIRFMAEAIRARSDVVTSQIDRLLAFQGSMRDLARSQPLRGVASRIAEDLIGRPLITPTAASENYEVTYQAANNAIARLVEAGVLREITGGAYRRLFVADEVLAIINA